MPPKNAAGQSASGCWGGLPDAVLIRVLCHLKAWEAVRTSLLSKRWRGLWATAPRLDIRQPCGCGSKDAQWRAERFAAFVKHLLLRRPFLNLKEEQDLEALRVCWSHPANDGDASTWIARAVRHGVREIELSAVHHAQYPLPDYLSFVPRDTTGDMRMRLKIVKLIHVRLDGTFLGQLCSMCSSLEELELKDCCVQGKEIQSKSLKCLKMVDCKFVDGFRIGSPNLVSLCCIRPFRYIPMIQNTGLLHTVTIMLDDVCLRSGRQCPQKGDQIDEFDDDSDFFGHAGSKDNGFAHSAAVEFGDNNHSESDESSGYYDSDRSGPSDDEGDDRIMCYSEIADEQEKKRHKYLINGNSSLGGNGMLCSLSNVERMDLLAHRGEMVLTEELKSCPDFNYLKTLSLGEWCMTPQLDGLATILNHSPNLENLFLHLDLAFNTRVGINPQGSAFACPNVKRVMITCSNRDVMVHRLAEFFRANGIPNKNIFVHRTASSGSGIAKGDAGSQVKRKAANEAESRDAKQRKPGN